MNRKGPKKAIGEYMTTIEAVGVPIGGGLGNKKVMLVEFSGTYSTTDKLVIPGLTQDPAIMLFSAGLNGSFADGKVTLKTATFSTDTVTNAEVANGTTLGSASAPIKGIIVF